MTNFLAREGVRPGNQRFVARNFLLDQGVSEERFRSYAESGCIDDHSAFEDWKIRHEDYYQTRVSKPSISGRHHSLDVRDEDVCPETFRHIAEDSPFHWTDINQDLIRLVNVSFVAERAGESRARIQQWSARVVASNRDGNTREFQQLDAALQLWSENVDSRPGFATFWENVRDLWEPIEQADWPDQLRDRLGLVHFDPASRGIAEINALVFRYPVSLVPRLAGGVMPAGSRPLVAPTVLDGRFSHGFCPAPRGGATGYTIALNDQCEPIRPEVVHPNVEFRASHVWRVGTIRRRIDLDQLGTFRGYHLMALRDFPGCDEYATLTDSDIS